MTKKIAELFIGRSNLANGLIAILVISLIVLGCTCNKDGGFDFGSNSAETSEKSNESKNDEPKEEEEETVSADFTADEDEVPTRAQSRALVKKTLLDFNEAVSTGDFTDFHTTIAKSWRRSSKPADFEKGFKEFIDKKVEISRIKGENPDFDPEPKISKKYGKEVLFLKGSYDTKPLPVNFNLEYIVDEDVWKLVFIGVDTREK